MQPWNLIQYWNDYIFNWINGYSIFLSAIIGILIVDYYILRKRSLILHGLYSSQGNYWYTNGINWIAIIALAVGIGAGFVGKFIPTLYGFYYYGPLIAITVGACVYLIFAKFCPSGSKRK
jgi:NCS1 family nucleobase:cation symporter-1